jgi:DNA-binding GntR family transcriptional regulator
MKTLKHKIKKELQLIEAQEAGRGEAELSLETVHDICLLVKTLHYLNECSEESHETHGSQFQHRNV